jgi:hypothetical protein
MSLSPDLSRRIGEATTLAIDAGDPEGPAVRKTAQTLDRQDKVYDTLSSLPTKVRSLLRKYPPPPQGLR